MTSGHLDDIHGALPYNEPTAGATGSELWTTLLAKKLLHEQLK